MSWLHRWLPRPRARIQLLCLPYAGGSAMAYRSWAANLPDEVDLVAAEFPGHGTRSGEAGLTSMTDLVAGLLTEMTPALNRPLAIFGHSMGALVALELARTLRRELGEVPAALLVSAGDAPSVGSPSWLPEVAPGARSELAAEHPRRVLVELGGLAEDALNDQQLMDLLTAALSADLQLLANYRYREDKPLGCPVRVYAGSSDPRVSDQGLAAWRRESPHDFGISRLPGGHFFLRECAPLFLARLGSDLTRLPARSLTGRSNGVAR